MGRGRGIVPRAMGAVGEAVVGGVGERVSRTVWLCDPRGGRGGSVRNDQTEVGRMGGCGE